MAKRFARGPADPSEKTYDQIEAVRRARGLAEPPRPAPSRASHILTLADIPSIRRGAPEKPVVPEETASFGWVPPGDATRSLRKEAHLKRQAMVAVRKPDPDASESEFAQPEAAYQAAKNDQNAFDRRGVSLHNTEQDALWAHPPEPEEPGRSQSTTEAGTCRCACTADLENATTLHTPLANDPPPVLPARQSRMRAAPNTLKDLPGLGPGLRWALRQAGIGSLSDLADANPDALRRKLGQIGQIIDLDLWIRLARQSMVR